MKTHIHARLNPEESRILRKLRALKGQTDSSLVREALHTLYQKEVFEKQSALSLVQDSLGLFSGPSDLSSNKKHLEGFGQ